MSSRRVVAIGPMRLVEGPLEPYDSRRMRGVWHILSRFAMGAVVLYAFFSTLAQISPAEAAGASAAIAALAAVLLVRGVRLDYEAHSRSADPSLRLARNRQRERRGF